jgi:hypothetical protein
MSDISAEMTVTGSHARPASQIGAPARSTSRPIAFPVVAGAAFALYCLSALGLQARSGTTYFGADTGFYAVLASGDVIDRIARFHPTTIAMASVWMKIFNPLTLWVAPALLLKAMFAAVGAVGVWAAMSAFAEVVPRRYVALFGIIYAVSFGVWYFSSIEESKIVTASLSALYIASYLQLRKRWSVRGVVLLTAILVLACLNEIVSCFLIVIPMVDTLVRRGWMLRRNWWIAAHALAGPIAFVILEGVINGPLVTAGTHPEGRSHLSMLVFYVSVNDFSAASLYAFVVNWLFFNLAAPTQDAAHAVAAWPDHQAYFEPALANYLSFPVSAGLAALFGVIVVACALPRQRAESAGNPAGILLALMAYTLIRGAFFFIFNPHEPLLFSSAVTLAHVLVISMLFVASSLPAKRMILAAFAILLFVTNGGFVIGAQSGPG